MSEMTNSEIATKTYVAFNDRDFEAAAAWVHDHLEFTDMAQGKTYIGPEAMIGQYQEWLDAFPDGHVEIKNVIEGSDGWVVVEFVVTGTNTGPFAGRPPSNKSVALHSCDVLHLTDGKVDSGRGYFDASAVESQIEG